MSPYRVQYNESEYDIKIYNFLYKSTKKTNTFEKLENVVFFEKLLKIKKTQTFILYYV